jgi:hypothetical protein
MFRGFSETFLDLIRAVFPLFDHLPETGLLSLKWIMANAALLNSLRQHMAPYERFHGGEGSHLKLEII